jgi:hypothetical protein
MLLELQAYWYPEGYDPEDEDWKIRGKKVELTLEELVINTNHVVAFHPYTKSDETMIRLVSGDVFRITMNYNEFKDIMFGDEIADDLLVSGEN